MSNFRRRLLGRRREIFVALRSGRFLDWLLDERKRKEIRRQVAGFIVRLIGLRRQVVPEITPSTQDGFPLPHEIVDGWDKHQRLWAAVLIRAIYDYIYFYADPTSETLSVTESRIGSEVSAWFQSEDDEIGSFLWVCDVLEFFSPEMIVSRIEYMTRNNLPRARKNDNHSD